VPRVIHYCVLSSTPFPVRVSVQVAPTPNPSPVRNYTERERGTSLPFSRRCFSDGGRGRGMGA
jgi:hypothetical protein